MRTSGGNWNRFSAPITEIEELTEEIVTDVLQEIIIYPGRRLNIVWNYRDEMEKLLLDINMGDGAGNTED